MTPAIDELSLPPAARRVLDDFLEAAVQAFGSSLGSVVLFGSAAEGRLRPTSDVNVMLVLACFEQSAADRIREAARVSQAAIQLRPMFLLKSELAAAAGAFALKFSDVLHRHRVLYGDDPFASVSISRQDRLAQLQQQLLNLTLRLRASYVARSLRPEQLVEVIADTAGPLRSCAAALLELEGQPAESPKQALERVAAALSEPGWQDLLALVSRSRETRSVPAGAAGPALFRLMDLASRMRARAETL